MNMGLTRPWLGTQWTVHLTSTLRTCRLEMHFPAQVQPVVHESQEKHMYHGAILGACSSHEFDSSLGDLIVSRPRNATFTKSFLSRWPKGPLPNKCLRVYGDGTPSSLPLASPGDWIKTAGLTKWLLVAQSSGDALDCLAELESPWEPGMNSLLLNDGQGPPA